MTTKYKMPKPHIHANLMIARGDGARIEMKNDTRNEWEYVFNPGFLEIKSYRVKPICDYALAKISEIGGDGMVELYLYWLDGGEIEDAEYPVPLPDDPFRKFMWYMNEVPNAKHHLRKKKRIVNQVLWVHEWSGENHMHDCKWLPEDYSKPQCIGWHKVPSCTREVEEND